MIATPLRIGNVNSTPAMRLLGRAGIGDEQKDEQRERELEREGEERVGHYWLARLARPRGRRIRDACRRAAGDASARADASRSLARAGPRRAPARPCRRGEKGMRLDLPVLVEIRKVCVTSISIAATSVKPAARKRGAHAVDRAFRDRRRVRRLDADRRDAVDHRRIGGELLESPRASRCSRRRGRRAQARASSRRRPSGDPG